LRINFRACLKLQKVSGKDGYRSNVFMGLLFRSLQPCPARIILEMFQTDPDHQIKAL
jgi:hypothetical protein